MKKKLQMLSVLKDKETQVLSHAYKKKGQLHIAILPIMKQIEYCQPGKDVRFFLWWKIWNVCMCFQLSWKKVRGAEWIHVKRLSPIWSAFCICHLVAPLHHSSALVYRQMVKPYQAWNSGFVQQSTDAYNKLTGAFVLFIKALQTFFLSTSLIFM